MSEGATSEASRKGGVVRTVSSLHSSPRFSPTHLQKLHGLAGHGAVANVPQPLLKDTPLYVAPLLEPEIDPVLEHREPGPVAAKPPEANDPAARARKDLDPHRVVFGPARGGGEGTQEKL